MKHKINCSCGCDNYSNNLRELYYTYWQSKSSIVADPTKKLKPIFDILNFKTMIEGLMVVVDGYGFGLTIGKPYDVRYDKNDQAIGAMVDVKMLNNGSRSIRVVNWKLYDTEYTDPLLKEITIQKLGWGKYIKVKDENGNFIIENGKPKKIFIENNNVFKAIFFKNNLREAPSLSYLSKIIMNIHDLDEKADKNRKYLNVLYALKSKQKLTPEQISNFGLSLSKDGLGILIAGIEGGIATPDVLNEIIAKTLSNWEAIKSETEYWKDDFFDFAGISKEKLSTQRENVPETSSRVSRVSAIEKEHFKFRQQFIDEYNEFKKTNVVIEFDTTIKNINAVSAPLNRPLNQPTKMPEEELQNDKNIDEQNT